jgi:hypothetical protein
MEIQGRRDGCTLGGDGRGRLGLDEEKGAAAAMRVGRGWGIERGTARSGGGWLQGVGRVSGGV